MGPRVLVAGIGNIFFRDDGFGPAVAAELLSNRESRALPAGVRVVDYGIRGMHLSYDLLDGVDALVLVDALPASPADGERVPGSISLLRVGPEDLGTAEFDAHAMAPVAVLASLGALGGELPPTFVVGCAVSDVADGIGLSDAVAAAVAPAAAVVAELARDLVDGRVEQRVGASSADTRRAGE
ncbi:MAG: hydrogenase maturation protease [Jatrophihabitantaceae bacterium]